MKNYSQNLWSGIFLVAGTCIGGGMLALPVASAQTGFFPSTFMMLLAWLMMMVSALYLIEAGFWMKKEEAHIISMSKQLLGTPGKATSWFLFLFISYASLIAYTAGCGTFLSHAAHAIFNIELSKAYGASIFILLFGPILFFRHTTLGKINTVLFFAMLAAYVVLISCSASRIEPSLIMRMDWSSSYMTLPLLLTAFSFQTMVPSLHPFLNHHTPSLKIAIIGGTFIALIFYLVWQCIVLGAVPLEGPNSLLVALEKGEAATLSLSGHLNSATISIAAAFFSFFALLTSFLGIGLGLYDFLADGCSIPKRGTGNILLALLICIPTLFFAITYERIFLVALDMTGGFGDAIMNGIIPVLMVFMGRYIYTLSQKPFHVPGGKILLLGTGLFYVFILFLEILMRAGYS